MQIKKMVLRSTSFLKTTITHRVMPPFWRVENYLAGKALNVGEVGYAKVNQPIRNQLGLAWQQVPLQRRQQSLAIKQKVTASAFYLGQKILVSPYKLVKNRVTSKVLAVGQALPEGMKKPVKTTIQKVQTFFTGLKPDVETEAIALTALQNYLDGFQAYLKNPSLGKPERTELVMLGKKISDYKRLSHLTFWGCVVPIPLTYLAEAGALMPTEMFLKSPLNNGLLTPLVKRTRENFLGTVIWGEFFENIVPFITIPFKIRRKHLARTIKQQIASSSVDSSL